MNDFGQSFQADNDFNKARLRETFSRFFYILNPERSNMISLQDAKRLLKPQGEFYGGMKAIPLSLIIGSEGRYRDFNRSFLPKHEWLRTRWSSVDEAHLNDIILPPIQLYQIGGVYFVRDGNHRVSVAKAQGREVIDAEIIILNSQITLAPNMSMEDLKRKVIDYEKKVFNEKTGLDKCKGEYQLEFTATGRYDELLNHIQVHKYYINQDKTEEISFEEAAQSWYKNVFTPVERIIEKENLLSQFPGRTKADLYVWLVKHWEELKNQYGNEFPLEEAVHDYSEKFGATLLERIKSFFTRKKHDPEKKNQKKKNSKP